MNLILDNQAGLSLANAKVLLGCAAEAYTAPPDISSTVTDTQVTVRRGQSPSGRAVVVISHRGTCDGPGWLRDFDATLTAPAGVAAAGMLVHKGFEGDVQSVLPAIRAALAAYPGVPIYEDGHSKGAAEAQNCAWHLDVLGYNVAGVYTFGGPRGGNAAWAADYEKRLGAVTWRFVNGSDLVPRVPCLGGLYRHAGNMVYLPVGDILGMIPSAAYKVNPSWLYTTLRDGKELARDFGRTTPLLADHHMAAYQAAVNALN